MNNNEYIFDKRKVKKYVIKYGVILLIALPVLIGLSYLLEDKVSHGWKITIMVVFGLIIVGICELVLSYRKVKLEQYNEERRKLQIQREREQKAKELSGESVSQNVQNLNNKKSNNKSNKKSKKRKQNSNKINSNAGRVKVQTQTESEHKEENSEQEK